jgi:truncated hemoglobin YjbI
MNTPLFEQAGGLEGLRRVVTTFYDAIFVDVMIGFFFQSLDKDMLIDREVEHAARMLGAEHIEYKGRPLREAHAKHPIMGGQFDRRTQLLREAMETHQLPGPVKKAWLEQTERLRPLITKDSKAECRDEDLGPPRKRGILFRGPSG